MFEWLEQELKLIKTNKFHLVNIPLRGRKVSRPKCFSFPHPQLYLEFLKRFGHVRLYRESLSLYMIGVFTTLTLRNSGFLSFGYYESLGAAFNKDDLQKNGDSNVYESTNTDLWRNTGLPFDEWLEQTAKKAKKQYTNKEWLKIIQGPKPFTDWEMAIVRARKLFKCRIVGVSKTRNVKYEVENNSSIRLLYLTITIEGKDLRGGAWLPVSSIAPGTKKIIEFDSYKSLEDPEYIRLLKTPSPGPEDRDAYWEFRAK